MSSPDFFHSIINDIQSTSKLYKNYVFLPLFSHLFSNSFSTFHLITPIDIFIYLFIFDRKNTDVISVGTTKNQADDRRISIIV